MNLHARSLAFLLTLVFLTLAGELNAEDVSSDKLPFVPTTIVNNKFAADTKWYTMTIRGNKMLSSSVSQIECASQVVVGKENLWCFVADRSGRYTIYNLAKGPAYVAYCASSTSHEAVSMLKKDELSGGASSFSLCTNGTTGYSFYYPGNQNACWNDISKTGMVALWNNSASSSDVGSNIIFAEYDISEITSQMPAEESLLPVSGDILYVRLTDNRLDAFPLSYVKSREEDSQGLVITDNADNSYSYAKSEVLSVGNTCDVEFPKLESFSFQTGLNNMLMEDAEGSISDDNTVSITVGSIGKRLYPTFAMTDEAGGLYINGKPCESKKNSFRFAELVKCTLTYPGCNMLRLTKSGEMVMYPFGRDYVIDAKFLCDNPTNEWGVPVVRINTNDGTMISSKDYYWDATIEIDGAGFFPDLKKTEVQIKGRGNTSWNGNMSQDPKNPYRLKFPSKKKVLGMTSAKSWVLIANSQYGSMLCNMLGSRAAELMECPAANHFIPVELYINGDYRGSYNVSEKIGFAKNSIVVSDDMNAALIELDKYYDEVYKFKSISYNLPVNIKEPDLTVPESTNLSFEEIQDSFNRLTTALKNKEDISAYADMKSLARFLFLNELIVNFEILHPKSTYCYNENIKDESSKFIFGPVWDFDWAFGYETARNYFTTDSSVDFWTGKNFSGRSFMYDLRYSGEKFNRQYYRVWHDFYNNHLDELMEYLEDYYAVVKKSYEHDNEKRRSGGSSFYSGQVENAKNWLKSRTRYVYNHLSNDLGYASKDYLTVDPEEESTAIEMLPARNHITVRGLYDIFGRAIHEDFSALPKGIYILDGRKIVKK